MTKMRYSKTSLWSFDRVFAKGLPRCFTRAFSRGFAKGFTRDLTSVFSRGFAKPLEASL